jgi:hypothetical protein
MRKALIPAFLLVLGAVILGSTVFREQLVHAATTPFQQVVVQNTSTNPVPVQQVGTSTTNVSGTVGIDPSKNTVKLDPNSNTVSLDSTDSQNLANVDTHLANIDSANSVTPITQLCRSSPFEDINAGDGPTVCSTSGSWDISSVVASGMDDDVLVSFLNGNHIVLQLPGSDDDGTSVYQLDFPRPLRADHVIVNCENSVEDCKFSLNVLGTANS